ncbi:8732_t:CDS:2 [Dentiscutata erythropus]|uniref:8732_t:CDS:1 n=1 Tax=Dentiscutata erythropus TaxID=1348616 RepID=A0A9N9H3F7_9GLOM|nr:8732_t:CDS:2 [Dentiscutata erythropus]
MSFDPVITFELENKLNTHLNTNMNSNNSFDDNLNVDNSFDNNLNIDNSFDDNLNINNSFNDNVNINNNFDNGLNIDNNNSIQMSNNYLAMIPSINVGQTFTSWCDVQQCINAYTMSQGFATRLDRSEKSMGMVTRADIVCRYAGTASKKSTGLRNTKSVATGCQFKITVHWAKTEYHVKSVNLEHNHLLDTTVVLFDPGYCKLSHNENDQIQILYNSGVPVPTIVKMLSEEYDRYIHNKDVYNSLNRHSRDHVKGLSQIAKLLNNLHNKKEYIVTYSINNNRLYCLFFTTHSALSIFKFDVMGITFLIASVLLSNETILTFRWALQQLKQVASNDITNKIRTILTDKDPAVLPAISIELPHVKYQFCTWHIEQNIVKNLTSKLNNKFMAFSKDFKLLMMENNDKQFVIRWNRLLEEYPEAKNYMEQWKPISHMWAYSYTNKNINYGIRTTQRSEASNTHLKHLLGHTAPLPELINMLEKLSRHQLEQSQYQQYRLCETTRQQCPKLLKEVSTFVVDFTFALLLDQFNKAASYNVEKQDMNLFKVFNKCKTISINYIGSRWIVPKMNTNNSIQAENLYNDDNSSINIAVLSSNYEIHKIPVSQQSVYKSTADLLKEIEVISNRVGYVEINDTLALFVNKLNEQYPLKEADIENPINIKTNSYIHILHITILSSL